MTNSTSASLKLVWLTDLHLLPEGDMLAGHNTIGRLDRALSYIQQYHADADFCVITGDLTEKGDSKCYEHIHSVMSAANIQYLPLTGNHDLRQHFSQHLKRPASTCEHFVQYAVNRNGIRVIALDTLNEGSSNGELCEERMTWLENELKRDPSSPTVLFCHHPPAELQLALLDASCIAQGQELLGLLSEFDNIKHVCFGHVHRPISGSFGNIAFTALRSTSIQAPLPYPPWSWDTFDPAWEAPELGIIYVSAEGVVIQTHPFCDAKDDRLI